MRPIVIFILGLLFSAISFANYCGPLNPYASDIEHQICAFQSTRENCRQDCTWYLDDGYPAPHCKPLNPYDSFSRQSATSTTRLKLVARVAYADGVGNSTGYEFKITSNNVFQ